MGIYKRIIEHGKGPPITPGQIVTVHCTGFGKNNDLSKPFWSTKDCQRLICPIPLSFEVGQGHVIKGWDEGVLGMQLGEVTRLTCTPDYAFGDIGCQAWGIESHSILEFEIEVLAINWKMMPEDSPVPASPAAATNRERTLGFPFSNFGRVLREVHKRKKAGFKVRRVTVKSTLKNHQPKLKRKMKHSSSGADEMDRGMTSHQPMLSSARVESGAVANWKIVDWDFVLSSYNRQNSRFSKMALQYYNEEQPDKFELVRVLHAQSLQLDPPGPIGDDMEEWCHLFFVGRSIMDPRVQKHFFAELMKRDSESSFRVKSCSTLEPGNYGDINHGCIICPPGQLLHPCRGRYFDHILLYRPVTWVFR